MDDSSFDYLEELQTNLTQQFKKSPGNTEEEKEFIRRIEYLNELTLNLMRAFRIKKRRQMKQRKASIRHTSTNSAEGLFKHTWTSEEKTNLLKKRNQSLSEEQKIQVKQYFDTSLYDNDLQTIFDAEDAYELNANLTIGSFRKLNPEKLKQHRSGFNWLDDELINFYMAMLDDRDIEKSKKFPGRRHNLYFQSFFYSKMYENNEYKYINVERWTISHFEKTSLTIFDLDKIFIPINTGNTHWTLAVVYVQEKKISYYDSFHGAGSVRLNNIKNWIKDEAAKARIDFNISEWTTVDENSAPVQTNSVDCGMFTLLVADYISDDLPLNYIKQKDMKEHRIKMGAAILQKNLHHYWLE